jgi:SAM-dependent methyltransferase
MQFVADHTKTLQHRERLEAHPNLMNWYRRLYHEQFRDEGDVRLLKILEIGSGASPLKAIIPNVITSDVLDLDYLDIVFDCHNIAELAQVQDKSLDIITLTNVLHHLRDPLLFLRGATRKLKEGGRLYLTEPYFSSLSYPMYKFLHHEPVDFLIDRPVLTEIKGPLSTANQAMPHMIFFSRPDWLAELSDVYRLADTRVTFFTGLSYPLTGGISRTFPIPGWLYRSSFAIDKVLAGAFPKLFASFFVARLVAAK